MDKDKGILRNTILLLIMIILSLIVYKKSTSNVPIYYETFSENYLTALRIDSKKTVKLLPVELEEKNKLKLSFEVEENATDTSELQKTLYAKVSFNSFASDENNKKTTTFLGQIPLEEGITEYEINLTNEQLNMIHQKAREVDECDFEVSYYDVELEDEIKYIDPIAVSSFSYNDAYVFEDITDYNESDKSEEEMENEVNYVIKTILINPSIYYLYDEELKDLVKEDVDVQHKTLIDAYNNYYEEYTLYYNKLLQKGLSKGYINGQISEANSLTELKTIYKELDNKANEKLSQDIAGYMKELNVSFNYSNEKIQELVKGKSTLEQKNVLEKEIENLKSKKEDTKNKKEDTKNKKEDK